MSPCLAHAMCMGAHTGCVQAYCSNASPCVLDRVVLYGLDSFHSLSVKVVLYGLDSFHSLCQSGHPCPIQRVLLRESRWVVP